MPPNQSLSGWSSYTPAPGITWDHDFSRMGGWKGPIAFELELFGPGKGVVLHFWPTGNKHHDPGSLGNDDKPPVMRYRKHALPFGTPIPPGWLVLGEYQHWPPLGTAEFDAWLARNQRWAFPLMPHLLVLEPDPAPHPNLGAQAKPNNLGALPIASDRPLVSVFDTTSLQRFSTPTGLACPRCGYKLV